MALLITDQLIEDYWHLLEDGAEITKSDNNIVSVERWQRDRDELIPRCGQLGILLKSNEPPDLIEDDIYHFNVICLDFPKFTDGRAYSYARLLREKYRFTGELRAVGNVLRDQLAFMRRCGINAFEIPDDANFENWSAAFNEISIRYQGANDNANVVRPDAATVAGDVAGNWSY